MELLLNGFEECNIIAHVALLKTIMCRAIKTTGTLIVIRYGLWIQTPSGKILGVRSFYE